MWVFNSQMEFRSYSQSIPRALWVRSCGNAVQAHAVPNGTGQDNRIVRIVILGFVIWNLGFPVVCCGFLKTFIHKKQKFNLICFL